MHCVAILVMFHKSRSEFLIFHSRSQKIKASLQPQVVEVNDDLVYHGWPYWDPKPRHVFKNGTSVYNGARI